MSSMRRSLAVVLVGALTVALGLTASAVGHKRLYNASISISLNKVAGGDTVSGQVTSKGFCVGGRTITVREDVDTGVTGDTTEIGRTVTDSSGQWTLPVQGGIKKDRTYFARVSKRGVKNDRRHKHTCKGATSVPVIGS